MTYSFATGDAPASVQPRAPSAPATSRGRHIVRGLATAWVMVISSVVAPPGIAHARTHDNAHKTDPVRHAARGGLSKPHGRPASLAARQAVARAMAPETAAIPAFVSRTTAAKADAAILAGAADRMPPPRFARSVRQSAKRIGADPAFLLAVAWRESKFDAVARGGMRHSTARGAFQFTEDGWLDTVRVYGGRHGLDWCAAKLRADALGHGAIRPRTLRAILNLRDDVALSTAMAGEYMFGEHDRIKAVTGREPDPVDYYLVLVLGPLGAVHFLEALERRPYATSFEVSGDAARRNPALFTHDGRPLAVMDAYLGIAEMLRVHMSLYTATASGEKRILVAMDNP